MSGEEITASLRPGGSGVLSGEAFPCLGKQWTLEGVHFLKPRTGPWTLPLPIITSPPVPPVATLGSPGPSPPLAHLPGTEGNRGWWVEPGPHKPPRGLRPCPCLRPSSRAGRPGGRRGRGLRPRVTWAPRREGLPGGLRPPY